MTIGKDAIEVILLRWSESSTGGRTVTFLLPAEGDTHPFRGLKDGKAGGQRFGMALAFLNDDETTEAVKFKQPVMADAPNRETGNEISRNAEHKPPTSAAKPKREITLAERIAMLCNDQDFKRFVWTECLDTNVNVADYVRDYCGVNSRSEIIYDTPQSDKWRKFYEKYQDWKRS